MRSWFTLRLVALLALSASITIGMQTWVGSRTIYAAEYEERRQRLHDLILRNAPADTADWAIIGANSTNIRVGSVYLAEGIHRATGMSVGRAYRLIDTVALFIALPLMVWLYRRGTSREHGLVAMLYVAAILPLTYVLHYFHPWDRLMLIAWVFMMAFVRDDRFWLLAIVIFITMIVKYDPLFVPLLYFMVHVRRETLIPVGVRTAALFALTFGMYFGLQMLFPGGTQLANASLQISLNFTDLRSLHIGYPPLAGLSVPVLLVAIGWPSADRFARACVWFAAFLTPIYFLNSNFAEMRALMPLLLLLIPAALVGLTRLTADQPTPVPERW